MAKKIIQPDDDLQPHQKRVIRRIQDPKTSGLVIAHGLGSGKTRTAIESHKAIGGGADVLLPAALRENYRKETEKWGGSPANVITHQAASLKGPGTLKGNTLIIDEGHRGRNPNTKLSDTIKSSQAKKRIILTGTPIYNNPADFATLVNQAAGKPILPEGKSFQRRYLKPNILDRLRGRRLSHAGELKKKLNQYVDYHKGDEGSLPKISAKVIPVEMGKHQSALYRATTGMIPPGLRMHKSNIDRLAPYLTGARQVSNTSRAIDPKSNEEPKLDKVFSDLKQHLSGARGKALVYSNWLRHGVEPITKRLTEAKIPHGVFTGKESSKVRDQNVRDYNSGKVRALVVSSSGSEGLDLKGTRLVQVVEPHFNNQKIRQVVGRSARIGSHSHLPPAERNVEVRQYIARPRRRIFGGSKRGVEDFLSDVGRDKDETNRQITRLLDIRDSKVIRLTSRVRTIRFAKPGEMSRKYLIGTHWTEDETSREALQAVTQRAEPLDIKGKSRIIHEPDPNYPSGKRMIRDQSTHQTRLVKASDLRDTEAFRNVEEKVRIQERKRIGGLSEKNSLRSKAEESYSAKIAERAGVPASQRIGQVRNAIAKDLNQTRNIIHSVRREQGISASSGADTIPDRILGRKQHGINVQHTMGTSELPELLTGTKESIGVRANLERLTEAQKGIHKARHDRLYAHVKNKVASALKEHGGAGDIETRAQSAMSTLKKPLNAIGKPIDHSVDYVAGPLRTLLKISPDQVRGLHEYMDKLAHPGAPKNVADIQKHLIGSRRIFHDIAPIKMPKAFDPGFTFTKSTKNLKRIGVAGAVIGGGLLAAKLYTGRKKPRDTYGEMSAKGRVIQFARGDYALRYIRRHAPEFLPPVPIRMAKVAAGAKKVKSSVVMEPSSLESMVRSIRKGTSDRETFRIARVQGAGVIHGGAGPSRDPLDVLKSPAGQSANPEFKRTIHNRIEQVKQEAQKKAGSVAAKKIRIAQEDAQYSVNRARMDYESQAQGAKMDFLIDRRKNRQKIGIAAGTGIGAGVAAGGLISSKRRDRPTEFSAAGDKLIFGYIAGTNKLERVERAVRRTFHKKIAPPGSIRRSLSYTGKGAMEGFKSGIPGGTSAGAILGSQQTITDIAGKIPIVKTGQIKSVLRKLETKGPIRLRAIDKSPVIMMGALEKLRQKLTHQDNSTGVSAHDVATGGVEGSLGLLATVPLEQRILRGAWKNPFLDETGKFSGVALGKRLGIGGAIGAIATGAIGYGVNRAARSRKKQPVQTELSSRGRTIRFAAPVLNRTAVTKDRYTKKIHVEDMTNAENNYVRTAIGGAAISALLRHRTGLTTGKAAVVGAGLGLGAQALVRHKTSQTKDVFGDRTYASKRIDRLPGQAAIGAAALIAGNQFLDGRLVKAAKKIGRFVGKAGGLVGLSNKGRLIQFADISVPEGSKIRIVGPKRTRSSWDKWIGTENRAPNYARRTEEVRSGIKKATGLAKDVHGALTGQAAVDARGRPRKREWEKPWVKGVIGTAILGGTLAGGRFATKLGAKGMPGALGELGQKLRSPGGVRNYVSKVVPGAEKIAERLEKFKGGVRDESGSLLERLARKANTHYDRVVTGKTLEPFYEVPHPTISGSTIRHHAGTPGYKKYVQENLKTVEQAAADKAAEEAAKQAQRARRSIFGLNARLDQIINFGADTVYDDRWEAWLRHPDRPGFVPRNRRPKRFYETEGFKNSVTIPGIAGASGVTGAYIGARYARKAALEVAGKGLEHVAEKPAKKIATNAILEIIHRAHR